MTSSLIEALSARHGLPRLEGSDLERFVQGHEHSVLFFAGNPTQYPESNDVAVILPELLKAFAERLAAAVVAPTAEHELQTRYGFSQWPALVFLRRGEYLGTITRIRDWGDYLAEIEGILAAPASRPPSLGVPVVGLDDSH